MYIVWVLARNLILNGTVTERLLEVRLTLNDIVNEQLWTILTPGVETLYY